MLNRVFQKLKAVFFSSKRHHIIDSFRIKIPNKHMLANYQERFCYYDKVLPAICELMNKQLPNRWIIDIGANIGDTVYSMLKHTEANFLCIEPDDDFYSLLEQNISSLDEQYRCRINCLKAFVVIDTQEHIKLKKKRGTAHKVSANNITIHTTPSFQLQQIICDQGINPEHIDLIKVDTDGFDWECLLSLGDMINHTHALLYWENQIDQGNELQRDGYVKLANYLNKAGYQHFFCFDNFGNFLISGNVDALIDINSYLERLNEKKTARTFYYVDVLACKEAEIERIKQLIKDFYQ